MESEKNTAAKEAAKPNQAHHPNQLAPVPPPLSCSPPKTGLFARRTSNTFGPKRDPGLDLAKTTPHPNLHTSSRARKQASNRTAANSDWAQAKRAPPSQRAVQQRCAPPKQPPTQRRPARPARPARHKTRTEAQMESCARRAACTPLPLPTANPLPRASFRDTASPLPHPLPPPSTLHTNFRSACKCGAKPNSAF